LAARKATQDFAQAPAAAKAASLRAAAAAGRITELTTLLNQGAPVDTPDESGETALMKAIRAKQAAAAALLLRRGANLELKNRAGQSARDIAASVADPALNRALGLSN
jgi:ankyrin repeat protein